MSIPFKKQQDNLIAKIKISYLLNIFSPIFEIFYIFSFCFSLYVLYRAGGFVVFYKELYKFLNKKASR